MGKNLSDKLWDRLQFELQSFLVVDVRNAAASHHCVLALGPGPSRLGVVLANLSRSVTWEGA